VGAGAPAASTAAPVAAPVASAGGSPAAAGVPTPPGQAYNVDNAGSAAPGASRGTKAEAGSPVGTQVAVAGDLGTASDGNQPTFDAATQASPPNLLLIGSLGLLAVGLLVFGLLFAGRRLR
jgi:hypothetical protein